MDKIHPAYYATFGLTVVGVWLFVRLFVLKKKNTLLSQQLNHTTTLLHRTRKRYTKLQEKHDKIIAFQNSLKTAELTTMLQKPRLDAGSTAAGQAVSEKYSCIQSLAEKGISIDEISSILAISTHEARQLVNLSKLAQENSSGNITV